MQTLLDLYEFSGNDDYLDYIERMIPVVIMDVLQPGGYIVNSDHRVDPWQMSYIAEGLGRYLMQLRAIGEDNPTALEALTRILGFLTNDAWVPEENRMCYYWDPANQEPLPNSGNVSQTSADGFIYGYLLTGWAGYIDMAPLSYDSVHATRNFPYYYSNTLATPAKNAGFRLRFGHAEMWHRQRTAEDLTAPVVENLRATDIEGTSTSVRFETDEQAARVLFVWPTDGAMFWRKNFNYYHEEHAVFVGGLQEDTEYQMAAMVVDFSQNVSWSEIVTFRTPVVGLNPQGSGGGKEIGGAAGGS